MLAPLGSAVEQASCLLTHGLVGGGRMGSRQAPPYSSPYRTLLPSVTPGPTTRRAATFTTRKACPPLHSAPTSGLDKRMTSS